MIVLREENVAKDIHLLDRAWDAEESFVFFPDGPAAQRNAVLNPEAQIPSRLHRHHFGLFTSGSTGEPKLIIASKERAVRMVETLHQVQAGDSVESAVGVLSLAFSFSLINQWLWARVHRRHFIPTDGFKQVHRLAEALKSAPASMLCLVGTHVRLFDTYFPNEVFPEVRRIHFAGGFFPESGALNRMRRRFPCARIFNNYGCTEAMPRLCIREDISGAESISADAGTPIPGVDLKLEPDGEIRFRSRYAAVGELGASGFRIYEEGDWIATGDAGRRDDRGHLILTGRVDEIIKRHGEKTSPQSLLLQMSGIWSRGGAVYTEMDELGEMGHVLVMVGHPEASVLKALLKILRETTPRSQWPLRIETIDELPLLPTGKVDRKALTQGRKEVLWRQRIC